MQPIDFAALDFDGPGKRGVTARLGVDHNRGAGFVEALMEMPAIKAAGIDASDLSAVLEGLGKGQSGDGLPLDGEALPEKLEAMLAALAGGAPSTGARGEVLPQLLQGLEGGALPQDGVPAEFQPAGELDLLLGGFGLAGTGTGTGSSGDAPRPSSFLGDSAAALPRPLEAERAQVLAALAELQESGLTGEELVVALQERLAALVEVNVGLSEAGEPFEPNAALAGGGAAAVLSGLALDGGERASGSGSMGEQIARELRIGSALWSGAPVASGDLGGNPSGHSGAGSSGGGQNGAAEALLEALRTGGGASGSDERSGGREFSALMAVAQGGDTASRSGGATYTIQQPVGQNGFSQALGERLVWMVNEGSQQARLQLNPAGMGLLDIQIVVGEERTTVNITAQNAVTREALQEDLGRLRQMLAEQGHEGVDVNISQGDGSPGDDDRERGEVVAAEEGGVEGGSGPLTEESVADHSRGDRGLIDHFA